MAACIGKVTLGKTGKDGSVMSSTSWKTIKDTRQRTAMSSEEMNPSWKDA